MKAAKKHMALILTTALLLGLSAPAQAAGTDTEAALSRAKIIERLWQQAGRPESDTAASFSDVDAEASYARAVRWAKETGIVNGYGDGSFGPDDAMTREQLAVTLYRSAQEPDRGFRGAQLSLQDYPDADQISDWAVDAMNWAVMQGIIGETDKGLKPKAPVTEDGLNLMLQRRQDAIGSDSSGIDYLVLVNKLHPLPEGWEDALETVTATNSVGDEVEVEAKAYAAYLLLKADLEENDSVYLELDSARRSVAAQQDIMNRFIEKYGADYAAKTVAQPGYSEHHTGLALDLYFKLKGEDGSFTDVYYNEDMVQYPEIWEKIHAKLADYGFILRYLEGKEHITGYGYEPWHLRYLDDAELAREIMSQPGLTLEEYLGGATAPEVKVDYGTSKLYTQEEMDEALVQIKCAFASFDGCELHSLRYAGDECNSEENIKWMNELDEGHDYIQVIEFMSDFHSPAAGGGAWNADTEYTDWQWYLARAEGGGWQLLTWGY